MKMHDKNHPCSIEAEEAVIGTLLSYPEAVSSVVNIINPDMFTRPDLSAVCKAAFELLQQGQPVDLITVTMELKKRGRDMALLLTDLSGRIVSSANLEYHALIIREKYLLRQYIQAGEELIKTAHEEDLEQVTEAVESKILEISGLMTNKQPQRLAVPVDEAIRVINNITTGTVTLIGVPSGFTIMDRITGGFKRGELTIIAARPSMGKTALAIQCARNAAEMGHPVGLFSLEMSEGEIARRFLSGASGYTNTELIQGKVDVTHLVNSSAPLLGMDIFIDDTSATSILELRAKARRLVLKHKIEMVIVDYLQLMTGSGQNREQEISNISRGLKSIAKDLNIPVITLSQLNREAESRADKRPQLSDLRESGAIEQDADVVWMIYRPAYYGIKMTKVCGEEVTTDGLMLINMAKNRNGVTGERALYHNLSLTRIYEDNGFTN
jgi:replicative DNA helicase